MKNLVVLTGAGMSAESGIPTFRDAGGLWEGYDVLEVATPEGWMKNPELVLDFYNQRRKRALEVEPNRGHQIIAELEKNFNTHVITQNVDDLHERAGSTKIIHLHGSLFESRSSVDERLIYPIHGWELKLGDCCEHGSQLRPNIVWFGELVHEMDNAIRLVSKADILLVVGTSLQVYPAASLIEYTKPGVKKIIVDPKKPHYQYGDDFEFILEGASKGMEKVKKLLAGS